MDDDYRGGLLGDELIQKTERHPEFLLCRKQVEHLAVILQLRIGMIALRVAFALPSRESQISR